MRIADIHCDTILKIQGGADIAAGIPWGHIDIDRLREGDVALQVFACFISSVVPKNKANEEAHKLIDLIEEMCQKNKQYLQLVEEFDEVKNILASPGTGIIIALENGHSIANNLKNLERFRLRGVRYMTLTHARNLDWAASSTEKVCPFEGLTPFGEKVIAAMNEMGIIIDTSHVHESTFWKVIKVTKKPLIASHSNVAQICPIARNLSDDQIKAIADSGGMVGINFFPGFLDQEYNRVQEKRCGDLFASLDEIEMKYFHDPVKKIKALLKFDRDFRKRMEGIEVGLDRIIQHIEYIIKLVGDEYVGFGSDFDGIPVLPKNVKGCNVYPEILAKLGERGIIDKSLEKIAYLNFLRVLYENKS